MLNHQKTILSHLSQDNALFKKELHKSVQWLNEEELQELYRWLNENYRDNHADAISEVFAANDKR